MQVKHNKTAKSGFKNILPGSHNITRHLTERNKNILSHSRIILFVIGIISFSTFSLLNYIDTVSALTYQDEIDMQFTFNPTVQIAVSGDLIIPDLAPGSSSDSNIITITAGSNDAHGYKLYGTVGSSSSNYTDLRLSSSNTTNVFTNLSSNKAALSNFSDNTWGYSYSTDSGSSWVSGSVGSTSSGYNGLPLYNSSNNASGVVLASTSSASETSLQFKIGAKAASTQVSGTYTNTINFIGVGNVVTTTYSLNYVDASGEGTGLPTNLSSQTTNDGVITLSDTTPTRTDYVFKGWCDTNNSSDTTTCTGTTYDPGRIYIIPAASQGGTVTVNMYAVWESAIPETTIANATYMQEVSSCPDTLTTGQVYSIKDSRDEQSYNVAKLADGKCWMTTNLNLAGGTTLNASDSNVPSDNYYTLPASSTSGFSDDTVAYVYNSGNTTSTCSSPGCYSYYSWLAATAGGKDSSGNAVSTSGYNAAYSICPKGWRLPTSTTSNASATTSPNWKTGDWYALATAYGANLESDYYQDAATFYNNAGPGTTPNFLLAGHYYSGSFNDGGSNGGYWSSTAGSSTSAYALSFYSGYVDSANHTPRRLGRSVRCVYGE